MYIHPSIQKGVIYISTVYNYSTSFSPTDMQVAVGCTNSTSTNIKLVANRDSRIVTINTTVDMTQPVD